AERVAQQHIAGREQRDQQQEQRGHRLEGREQALHQLPALRLANSLRRSSSAGWPLLPAASAAFTHWAYTGSTAFFHTSSCAGEIGTMVWPGVFSSLAWPESSSSPHAPPTLPAHSLLQWSSMTFFWPAASLSYQGLLSTHT